MRARTFCLALVFALGAVACGADGDENAGDAEEDALTTTTTTSTAADPATGDEALVNRIVLQQSDFPAGWTATPGEQGDDGEERAVAECLGVEYDPDRPQADSPEFSKGELNQVVAVAELAPTPEMAAAEFAAVKGPNANECFKASFDRTVAEDAGGVSFLPAQVEVREAPKLGDGAHALRITTGVSAPDGSTVPIYADFVFIQKGRAEISLAFITGGEPFDPALAGDLAQKLASRA